MWLFICEGGCLGKIKHFPCKVNHFEQTWTLSKRSLDPAEAQTQETFSLWNNYLLFSNWYSSHWLKDTAGVGWRGSFNVPLKCLISFGFSHSLSLKRSITQRARQGVALIFFPLCLGLSSGTAGALRRQETLAPLAGQPQPPRACGQSHVHPHVPHQDQLPQHQADHSCVSRGASAQSPPRPRETDSIFLSCTKKEKENPGVNCLQDA